MFVIRRVVGTARKQLYTMSELNDNLFLEEKLKNNELLIQNLKDEVKQLLTLAVEVKKKALLDENTKLQQNVHTVMAELVRLQRANGVLQVPVPGDGPSAQQCSNSSPAVVSSNKEAAISSQNIANETKTAKPPKVKKPAAGAAVDEGPVDVGRLDIRVGKMLEARLHPDADTLYLEQIDVGDDKPRTVVSGLVRHIPLSELDQRLVLVLCNLKPQKMRGIMSEGMVLCASTPERVELLAPPPGAKAGNRVSVPGFPRNPDLPFMNPKKKIFEKVAEELLVGSQKQACYRDVPWQVDGCDGYITAQTLSGCHIK